MKPISKWFYLVSLAVCTLGSGICYWVGLVQMRTIIYAAERAGAGTREHPANVSYFHILTHDMLCLIGLALAVLAGVIFLMLLYRLWSAIQGPTARTKPWMAVAFCFIPYFQYYWVFVAIRGWAKDYNAMLAAKGLSSPKCSVGVALTLSVLSLIGVSGIWVLALILSYAGPLAYMVVLLAFLSIFINSACNGVNSLVKAR